MLVISLSMCVLIKIFFYIYLRWEWVQERGWWKGTWQTWYRLQNWRRFVLLICALATYKRLIEDLEEELKFDIQILVAKTYAD